MLLSIARPLGLAKLAAAPAPSAQLLRPLPARVPTEQPLKDLVAEGVTVAEGEAEAVAVGLELALEPALALGVPVALRDMEGHTMRLTVWAPLSTKSREPEASRATE